MGQLLCWVEQLFCAFIVAISSVDGFSSPFSKVIPFWGVEWAVEVAEYEIIWKFILQLKHMGI